MSIVSSNVSSTSSIAVETNAAATNPVVESKTGVASVASTIASATGAVQQKNNNIFTKIAQAFNSFCKKVEVFFSKCFAKPESSVASTSSSTQSSTAATKATDLMNLYLDLAKGSMPETFARDMFNIQLSQTQKDELSYEVWVQDGSKDTDADFGLKYIQANPKGELVRKALEAICARNVATV